MFAFTDNLEINALLNQVLGVVKAFTERQDLQIEKLNEIGMALSSEQHLDRLLSLILSYARQFTCADGGTLYLMADDQRSLKFTVVETASLGIRMGGEAGIITWPDLPLYRSDGSENREMVAALCALRGETINIADVYEAEGFNFEGTKHFDASTGFRSRSMLVVPMKNYEGEVIGVCQLINRVDSVSGAITPFAEHDLFTARSLASQAAVAISNVRLIHGLRELLESFIHSIATAIDAKSPYTGGHVRKVAKLAMLIAQALHHSGNGRYQDVRYSLDDFDEIRIAALMHDVGKISTPEYVVDKATKLQTIYDRIDIVLTRIEVLKRDRQLAALRGPADAASTLTAELAQLDEAAGFLAQVNVGGEFMRDQDIQRVRELASLTWTDAAGHLRPLLTADEVDNLCVRKGTLTAAERHKINEHAQLSNEMLEQLPFPKKLRRVPEIAGGHHEKLNGKGYPRGLNAGQLSLETRIMALADIFEALTACDRPYKPAKPLSEARKIIEFMVKDGELDGDLVHFFFAEGLDLRYGREELKPEQLDV